MDDIIIYIDDSGQLHPNYPHSSVFVYGGYWTTKESDSEINKYFGKLKRQIFKSNKEVKSSNMSESIKIRIIKRLKNKFKDSFNPIFVSVDVKALTIDFKSKQTVQLHKNYLIRRFVETAIAHKRKVMQDESLSVHVHIDDQSKTKIENYDSLDRYISKMMTGRYGYRWMLSNAQFTVKYEDSKSSNGVQIADVLANSKMDYHIGKFKKYNLKTVMKNKNVPVPLKLPVYWTSESIKSTN
ncbi:DUF3800 domain-containing protein [Leuconostoc pseudomesenteroides]|uniref:DUF3800 domain-containing protein n=1 Tax=Leuconostoc pseudomesenteroides TaxID=33968 RepID=UPI0039E8D674